jgi:hypothetical protein
MRSCILLLILALAGCVSTPGPTRVEGSYVLTRINGQALPAPSPTEDGVTMLGATLLLAPDGRFSMQATASSGTEPDASGEDVQGAWSVRGDSLLMTPDVRDSNPGPSFRWTLDGRTLTLYDEDGHEYTFRRR